MSYSKVQKVYKTYTGNPVTKSVLAYIAYHVKGFKLEDAVEELELSHQEVEDAIDELFDQQKIEAAADDLPPHKGGNLVFKINV